MPVKLNAALPDPDKTQDNGIEARLQDILRRKNQNVIAVVILHARTIEENVADGSRSPKMDIVAIEVMDGPDEALAMDMLSLVKQNRTGQMETRATELAARARRRQYADGDAVNGGHQPSMLTH